MTEHMLNMLVALSGIGIGVAGMIIAYFINKRINQKMRLFNERHQKIRYQAKTLSWNITMVGILIAWVLAILYKGISFSFFLITGLYILHCVSMLISTVYFAGRN
ncbi:DUF2178 domain-containing protein [Bacillus sonorensis]|uniref:hypothetical protein n=1 Tax=Bacillus sonorensis TaxID=119858 RepID=UPI00049543D1|nr:hypothetical protein [Bacillus sonorensis]MCY7858511.1 DUF2178 domain-containing protein [Bacillus sonorensis]MCZ0098116.1 DUF2178 domain-containing protein [Bacillus sonorensis]MEC1427789.1 DUF2178 domain-containing protein [Bacillus sonorensis]MEC1519642.1 DUF2178 domain-containing protein [Bacillus sonorensis]MEC1538332.1 DUF2178 domain-containing protein [Bacillus sonorensis]